MGIPASMVCSRMARVLLSELYPNLHWWYPSDQYGTRKGFPVRLEYCSTTETGVGPKTKLILSRYSHYIIFFSV